MAEINNIPNEAYEREFIVVRNIGGEWFHWDSFDNIKAAALVAELVGGKIFHNN